jgi:hypothetical protein
VFYKIFIFGNSAPPPAKKGNRDSRRERQAGYEHINTDPDHH